MQNNDRHFLTNVLLFSAKANVAVGAEFDSVLFLIQLYILLVFSVRYMRQTFWHRNDGRLAKKSKNISRE